MKKKFVLGALCVSMILASGIGASAEVSESHSQWAEESLISADEAELLPNFFAEVSYKVGINDPLYFSKCFKAQFGVSPSAYQKGERSDSKK